MSFPTRGIYLEYKKNMKTLKIASAAFPFRMSFLPAATAFVENSSMAFGFGTRESSSLVLATEELYSYYCEKTGSGSVIEISLENEIYRLVLLISFRMTDPDMKVFNITFNKMILTVMNPLTCLGR